MVVERHKTEIKNGSFPEAFLRRYNKDIIQNAYKYYIGILGD